MVRLNSLLLFVLIASCNTRPDHLNRHTYLEYIQDSENGYSSTISLQDVDYVFQLLPAELMILRNNYDKNIDDSTLASQARKYKNTLWMSVQIRSKDPNQDPLRNSTSDVAEYQRRSEYYSFHAQQDFSLVYGADTLNPFAYFFQDPNGLRNYAEIITGYKIPDSSAQQDLVFRFDDGALDNKALKFVVDKINIEKLPAIFL